jgi:periplasmic divalent cation tolerance protein
MENTEKNFILILTTCPSEDSAQEIASEVISNCLAGCVNILTNLLSIYRWQGKVEKTQEYLLMIKTHIDYYPQVEQLLKQIHPYQVPEIIAIPINRGSTEYLTWLEQCLKS